MGNKELFQSNIGITKTQRRDPGMNERLSSQEINSNKVLRHSKEIMYITSAVYDENKKLVTQEYSRTSYRLWFIQTPALHWSHRGKIGI